MRHFFETLAVAALAGGMGEAPSARALIAPSRLAQRSPASPVRTLRSAVDVTAVAIRADLHQTAAAGAAKQTGTDLHRHSKPMKQGGFLGETGAILQVDRAALHTIQQVRCRG